MKGGSVKGGNGNMRSCELGVRGGNVRGGKLVEAR